MIAGSPSSAASSSSRWAQRFERLEVTGAEAEVCGLATRCTAYRQRKRRARHFAANAGGSIRFDLLCEYRKLAEEGRSVAYITAPLSVSPATVKRRVKLADVSLRLLALGSDDVQELLRLLSVMRRDHVSTDPNLLLPHHRTAGRRD